MAAPKSKTAKTPLNADTVVAKARTDWEAIERDYRTGLYTLRELETKHGAVHSTIDRKAKRDGWSKDLAKLIRQETNAKLIAATLQQDCDTARQNATKTVSVASDLAKDVILGHRKGLKRLTDVKIKLLAQIEQAADNMVSLSEVIEMVRNPDDNGIDRANDALRKAMGRSALVDDLKKLADVDERVRKGEREAFSLDDTPPPEKPEEEAQAANRFDAFFAKLDKINAAA